MADTLAEIYRNTLTSSDFDSNGEVTIVTTNSSTSHVIKNIQAVDTDTNIPINGTLKVNDFDVVGLTANSSGSEIIAPSSTVKVKTSAIPFNYQDLEFNTRANATTYRTTTQAKINGYTAISEIYNASNTTVTSISTNSTEDTYAPFIGSNDYHYSGHFNFGSTSQAYVWNNTGSVIFSHTQSYTPKWFDGYQYSYYYGDTPGISGNHIIRIDIAAGTASRIKEMAYHGPSSDPKMFGITNADGTLDRLFFWSHANASDGGQVYNAATGNVTNFTNVDPNSVYGTGNAHNQQWYAIKRTNGSYRFVYATGQQQIRFYDWSIGDVHTSSISPTQIDTTGNDVIFNTRQTKHSVHGTKLYYLNNDNKVAAWDFDPDTPTQSVIGTNQHATTYGSDLTLVVRTPSTSTINARSYGVSPSLKLRVTGITST